MPYILALIALFIATPAVGFKTNLTPITQKPKCVAHDKAMKWAEGIGEQVQFMGITANGEILEVIQNPADGDWSILVTPTSGCTIMVVVGSSGEFYSAKPVGLEP